MTPGERVELLKKLAGQLGLRTRAEIDLILRQFRLDWSPNWRSSDMKEYSLHHIEDAHDDTLLSLHDYLFSSAFAPDHADDLPDHWDAGHFRLFLSHTHHHKDIMGSLKQQLSMYGVSAFLAHDSIKPTKEWISEIETALATCHALAAFLTPEFHESRFTDQEIGYCLSRSVLIVPIKYGFDPYGFIERYQAQPGLNRTPAQIAEDLFGILLGNSQTAAHMDKALVSYFTQTKSYNETRRRWSLVQKVKQWTPELLNELGASIETKVDIRDCDYRGTRMPTHIKNFIEEHSSQEDS